MTAIVACWNDGEIWMAADRRHSSTSGRVGNDETHKIHRFGGVLFAYSGAGRGLTLLSKHSARMNEVALRSGACAVIEEFRTILREDHWKSDTTLGPDRLEYSLLVASPLEGLLFGSCEGGIVHIDKGSPFGIGSGGEWAEGAAAAMLEAGFGEEASLRAGILIAIRYDFFSGGTPDIVKIAVEQGSTSP